MSCLFNIATVRSLESSRALFAQLGFLIMLQLALLKQYSVDALLRAEAVKSFQNINCLLAKMNGSYYKYPERISAS